MVNPRLSQGYFSQFDYALCHLDQAAPRRAYIEVPDELEGECHSHTSDGTASLHKLIKFENLSIAPRRAKVGEPLVVSGFGCFYATSQAIDHQLRAGILAVGALSNNYFIFGQRWARTGGILCPGDSGGAAYALSTPDPYDRREIVGVNSASIPQYGLSYVARTGTAAFVRFLRSWRLKWPDAMICGIDRRMGDLCHK